MVVMPDPDFDPNRRRGNGGSVRAAGERCMAISVVVAVDEKVADELVGRLEPRVRNLKIPIL